MWESTQGTLEFKFGRNKSSNKKGTCKDSGKRKAENNADPLLSGTADLVTMGVGKAKILSAFLASFVIGCPRSESGGRVCGSETSHAVQIESEIS